MKAPIILFTYNRPWHTEQTLQALSRNEGASESVLYIFCDGPKPNASAEQCAKIASVRQVAHKATGFKAVHVVEAVSNKGLANSIIGGVSDVIKTHGRVIVLEDDLVTSPYFLRYMNAALDFYESYPAVFSVSANRPPKSKMEIPSDYEYDVFVCLRSYSTGWGTWRDRWEKVDWTMADFKECAHHPQQIKALNRMGEDMFDLVKMQEDGKIDSWAMRFGFAHFKHHAVAILPCHSYVDNIGFDGTGTHCGTIKDVFRNDLSEAVPNPRFLDIIYEDDRIINAFYSWFYPKKRPLYQRVCNTLARLLGRKPPFTIKKKVYN